MVKWKPGDKFIVIKDKRHYYLKKGEEGRVYRLDPSDKNLIYFNEYNCISIDRIQKIDNIYELW